ncbi:hypothetical protein Gotur_034163 [Gossypium turneri]
MFMEVVAISDKTWTSSSGTLPSEFFKHVDNDIPEENEEKNVRNDVHILNHVYIDGNSAARLSSQIEKLCNAVDNMSQATSSLTPDMDPYGIPQAIKMLDYMSEEVQVMSMVDNSSGDEREKKGILQCMEYFN